MQVLLICDIPDLRAHPAWARTADVTSIREAIRGLCQAVAAREGTLWVPPQPAVVGLVGAIMPAGTWRILDDVALLEAKGVTLDCAVLIGGMDAEIDAARAMHASGVRVFPIGSTGAAAKVLLAEAKMREGWDIVRAYYTSLSRNGVYAPMFDVLLSL